MMDTSPSLTDRVVIVTGASRGIGKGLALGLAEAGAKVVCAARSGDASYAGLPGTVSQTVAEIRKAGGTALAVRCDIGNEDEIHSMVDATLAEFGRVDALMNNAMASTPSLFDDLTGEMWDQSMRVNVRSLLVTAQAVVPIMKRQGSGSIINMSSGAAGHIDAHMPPGYLTYSVAKAAMERFTTALSHEVAQHGIAVNALRPGAVKTETSVHELGEDYDWSGWRTPEAVVPSVVFLAAQDGSSFTGQIVDANDFGQRWP